MAGGLVMLVIGAAGAPTITERVCYGFLGCVGLWVGSVGLMRRSVLKMRRVRTRRRRARQGLCVECGYNLKGLTHLRCPECGHQNVPYEEYDEYAPLEDKDGE
jgi:hypothetical protein